MNGHSLKKKKKKKFKYPKQFCSKNNVGKIKDKGEKTSNDNIKDRQNLYIYIYIYINIMACQFRPKHQLLIFHLDFLSDFEREF